MLADHEMRLAPDNAAKEAHRTEIAVRDPQVAGANGFQHGPQQGTLLGMAILAREHVDRQHPRRVQHDQRLSGQRGPVDLPQLLQRRRVRRR